MGECLECGGFTINVRDHENRKWDVCIDCKAQVPSKEMAGRIIIPKKVCKT